MSGDPTDEEPSSGSDERDGRPEDPMEADPTEAATGEERASEEPEEESRDVPDQPQNVSDEGDEETDRDEETEEAEPQIEEAELAPQADLSESWSGMDHPAEEYQSTESEEASQDDEVESAEAGDGGDVRDDKDRGNSGDDGDDEEGEEAGDDGDDEDGVDRGDDGDDEDGEDPGDDGDDEDGVDRGDDGDDGDGEEGEDEGPSGRYTETKIAPVEDEDDEGADTHNGDEEDQDDGATEVDQKDEDEEAEDEAETKGETRVEEADDREGDQVEADVEPEAAEAEDEEGDEDEDEDEAEEGDEDEEEVEDDEEDSDTVEFHDDTTPIQRKTGPASDQEQPLADHIEEMVKRLAVVVIVAGLVSLLAFPFGEEFINFLWYSVLPSDISKPHVYHPLELVISQLKAASLLGLVLALPVFVYETYAFMRPGLYPQERRYYLAAVPTSLILAFIGLLFGYFLVLPAVLTYFLYYSRDVVEIAFALSQTFNLMLILLGYLALVFQIPLFIMLAIMMGLTSRTWLEDRRLIFWGAFLGISFLFSPDPTGMAPILVAATMIALFEGTLLLLRWTNRGG